jgi:hypothetical protein
VEQLVQANRHNNTKEIEYNDFIMLPFKYKFIKRNKDIDFYPNFKQKKDISSVFCGIV